MNGHRDEWTGKDTAQCVGMLALTGGGLAACTGNLSLDCIRAYAHTASETAVPVVAGIGSAVLAVGLVLLMVRHLRVALTGTVRTWWIYRRRWAAVLDDLELTVTGPAGTGTKVPQLRSVVRIGDADVLSVRMVRGQSAAAWHERCAELADEFGAASARVRFGDRSHRDVQIVFTRSQPRAPRREQLALPAPQPHPIPLALPVPAAGPQQRQRQSAPPRVAVRVAGLRLQIVAAVVPPQGQNKRRPWTQRFGVRGELRWNTAWMTAAAI